VRTMEPGPRSEPREVSATPGIQKNKFRKFCGKKYATRNRSLTVRPRVFTTPVLDQLQTRARIREANAVTSGRPLEKPVPKRNRFRRYRHGTAYASGGVVTEQPEDPRLNYCQAPLAPGPRSQGVACLPADTRSRTYARIASGPQSR
jgi:hypothetical protein